MIICEIIVHLLVIVQNNKRCAVHVLNKSKNICNLNPINNWEVELFGDDIKKSK